MPSLALRARSVVAVLLLGLSGAAVGACQPGAEPGGGGAGGTAAPAGTGGTAVGSGGTSATGGSAPTSTGGSPATGGSPGGTGGIPSATGGTPGVNPPAPDAGSDVDPGPAPSAVTMSEACGKGMPAPMDGIVHTIQAADMPRKFFLRVPASYDGKKAFPMVFAFHGAGNKDATWFDTNTGWRAAHEDKAVMLFPESLTAGGSHTWMTASQHPANLAFVEAMIDWTKKNLCIDPSRIFTTGQSSGAYFSQTLACQRGDIIRAAASNSGGERYFENCKGNPGVLVSYGKGDENSHVTAANKAIAFWIVRNGCKPDAPMMIDPAPCVQYTGCKTGSPVVACAHGGGHDWPGYANAGFWKFFTQF